MKNYRTILILFGWAYLVTASLCTANCAAQTHPVWKRVANQFLEPDRGQSARMAQDTFHTVNKRTATPFGPPANPAVPDVKTIGTNLNAFGVPFNIEADDETFVEVQLYLSRDMGQTWDFYDRQRTDRNDFPFQADGDGEYWFALKTLNRDRRLVPEGDPHAELKIIVDTVKPKLDFRIETDAAGRVACRWTATDTNLVTQSFRMMYQPVDETGSESAWQPVPVELNGRSRVGVYADQVAWWPDTSARQLNVAIEIRDIGGNITQVTRQVVVPPSAWRHRTQSVAQITDTRSSQPRAWNQLANDGSPTEPGPSLPGATSDDASAQTAAKHPPNVVCEDGVCRVVSSKLIGSDVEEVDPPIPPGYNPTEPSRHASSSQNIAQQPKSIVWESEPQARFSQNRSMVGTTVGSGFRPDPSLAPAMNPNQQIARPVTDVPSNPAVARQIGGQFVSESSTMGATNQYRGRQSQNDAELPPPTLLPNHAFDSQTAKPSQRVVDSYPDTGHPGFEGMATHGRQDATQNSGGFMNAGHTHRERPIQSETNRGRAAPVRAQPSAQQVIGTRRFRLDYGIDAIDPSGVERVDLWMTPDGRNWNAWGSDPDNQSPFPVEVEADGQYGFRIVVHSKDGLTGQGPSTGDPADLWVLVDSQSPMVQITSVPYGRNHEAGKLAIHYSVSDEHITLRPITLGYSKSPEGPWNLIGEGIRNEGRFLWKPTTDVPDQIYLRIEALDKAGNVGRHVLSQAIDVSGLVPKGTIRGVSPVGR